MTPLQYLLIEVLTGAHSKFVDNVKRSFQGNIDRLIMTEMPQM